MNELQVIVTQKPAEISFNFDEIKQSLSEQMEIYKSMEVTEEVLAERKKDIATLRKIAKAIDDKRKEVKSNYMIPYEEFEKKAKELVEIINEPIELINKQVKEFDEKQKAEKRQKAFDYYLQKMGGQSETLEFEEVFKDSWLNVNTSFKSIKNDIDTALSDRLADLEAIAARKSEVEEKAIAVYKQTKKLSDAMKIINDYDIQKKAILEAEERRIRAEEERRKREEERKAREEQERLSREQRERELAAERERQSEIDRIRAEERAKVQEEVCRQQEEIRRREESQRVIEKEVSPFPIVEEVDFPGSPFPVIADETPFPAEEVKKEESVFEVKHTPVSQVTTVRYMVKGTEEQHKQVEKILSELGVQFAKL
ncbi:DUF1351 domain-containing protein [Lachnoclostridium phytofermentans]|uniref:DUF1351 domain-containing protein n=1 Tax=Lachnoclostridium phytofermentans (strain ATCC 700394 / DSM 18823 / ISDg) TaxID=357809 RepID=A9KQ34_LACP7|nr:DUF1351 domain-containing protein [Lachnoclostridium phytofermentans]ABX43346.1 hypothetical protein Cphy_2989 [Lachnoclostridium phytofermentans ISDg]